MNSVLDLTEDDLRCPGCGGEDFTGVEVWGVYGGALYWECLSRGCGHLWHRWPEGHGLREQAVSYMRLDSQPVLRCTRTHVQLSTKEPDQLGDTCVSETLALSAGR